MKKAKTKKWFGLLLMATLLLQLSYHTVHVFTHHASDFHMERTASNDTQIAEASLTCELCAKLLGRNLFLPVFTAILIAFALFAAVFWAKADFYSPQQRAFCLLRGPPTSFR